MAIAPSSPSGRTRWDIVTVAVLAGILAGMQIGKVAPAIPVLRSDLGLDFVAAGWVASLFNLSGALLGAMVGASADRIGPRRASQISLLCLAVGSLWGGMAESGTELMLSRGLESFGFIGVAVSSPRMIVSAVHERDRDLAFGIWGTYVPAGMAIAIALAPALMPLLDWRGVWLLNAGLAAGMAVVVTAATHSTRWQPPTGHAAIGALEGLRRVASAKGPWLLALTFGVYSIQFLAVMSWLPSYLIDEMGLSPTRAALATALVVAANTIGNIAAGALLARGVGRSLLLIVAFAGMALCGVGTFGDWLSVEGRIAAAFVFSAIGGMIPGGLLAGTAVHAPTPVLIGVVNGLMMQGSNLGSLTGPPIMAFIVSTSGGWHGAIWHSALACLVGVGAALALARAEKQRGP